MSQHCLQTEHKGRRVTVQLGWDRPLQQFYLVVFCDLAGHSEDTDAEGYLYFNLADPVAMGCKDLDYFRNKLQELDISVPESMFREVRLDAHLCVSNRHVVYQEDGTFSVLACGTHHALIR